MKNFIAFLIVALIVFPFNKLQSETLDSNESKIYKIIQTAYIKETDMFYFTGVILKRFTPVQNLVSVVNRHKSNISFLRNIMSQYSIEVPEVSVNSSNLSLDLIDGCKKGLLQEQELSSFYNNSIITLRGMNINETIGMLIEVFSTLRDNALNENSLIFRSCSGNK